MIADDKLFFNYIFIFDEHEIQLLQSLRHNHKSIISQFGFKTSRDKSSYTKDIIWGKIGFQFRPQRNHSDLVYDMCRLVHWRKMNV